MSRPRTFLAPEVVQTSGMDCGPASLKSLLQGFGVEVSYGRLREACQTDVDGTSIDTMEEIAIELGLDAEQLLLPLDHLLLEPDENLPAIVVVRLPEGSTHFVVVFRRYGPWVQIMDPAVGRRWMPCAKLLDDLYVHAMALPADRVREWAASDDFVRPLKRRLAALGVAAMRARELVAAALGDSGWHRVAALDASTRMCASLLEAGAIQRGAEAERVLRVLFARAEADADDADDRAVPPRYWSFARAPASAEGEEQVLVTGAVLVRAKGLRADRRGAGGSHEGMGGAGDEAPARPLSPELLAALREPPAQPLRYIARALGEDGALVPAMVALGLAVASLSVLGEALLFRAFFDVGEHLGLGPQRFGAVGAVLFFLAASIALEVPRTALELRVGRRLEVRLRVAFLERIARLGDRYFQSRPVSDMAERGHSLRTLRDVPAWAARLLRATLGLVTTTIGIAWLDASLAPLAALGALLSFGLGFATLELLGERDMRFRTHAGALTRFYFDALRGMMPIRAHGAERSVRLEHEGLLTEWAHAGNRLQSGTVLTEGAFSLVGLGVAAALVHQHVAGGGDASTVLLLAYWALRLPAHGALMAVSARQYPALRNVVLRLLELLTAPEDAVHAAAEDHAAAMGGAAAPAARESSAAGAAPDPRAVSLELEDIDVVAAGHTILHGVRLTVAPGEHVAIVGPSGAGKSSLVGLFLGWHRAAAGRVLVDGEPLTVARTARLRRETAWVDPEAYLWNRSLFDNLLYGADSRAPDALAAVVEAADLRGVLEKLPEGLQTALGEAGALVSGGEGQRVRLGRALMRSSARLVIFDEPFRGLDRERRRELLGRARGRWSASTLLCITHDLGDTLAFPRVVVIEGGEVVEDGAPSELAAREGSRYRSLLDAERDVREALWSDASWRRIRLADGRMAEAGEEPG